MLAAYYVGSQTGLDGAGLLGVAVAVGGMLGSAPYVLAMDGMGSIADQAGGIVEMTLGADRPDVRARARLLDAVGCTTKAFTKALAAVASSLACFLLLAVFLAEVSAAADTSARKTARRRKHARLEATAASALVKAFVVQPTASRSRALARTSGRSAPRVISTMPPA